MIERVALKSALEAAFEAHVERLFATYALGVVSDSTALTHFESGMRVAVKCREHALRVCEELTPDG